MKSQKNNFNFRIFTYLHKALISVLPSFSSPKNKKDLDLEELETKRNYGVPLFTPFSFYTYYLPQYFAMVYRHKQLLRFFLWAILQLASHFYFPIVQYQIMLWDQATSTQAPLMTLLPMFAVTQAGSILLDGLCSLAKESYQIQLKNAFYTSLNKSIFSPLGADIVFKDTTNMSEEMPLNIIDKAYLLNQYIENLSGLLVLAVMAPIFIAPTVITIIQTNLAIPAVYITIVCSIFAYLGNEIGKFKSDYSSKILVSQTNFRLNLESVAYHSNHKSPNALPVNNEFSQALSDNLTSNRLKMTFIEQLIGLTASVINEFSKPIINIMFLYPKYLAKIINLDTHTNLLTALCRIPMIVTGYVSSNNGVRELRRGAGVLKHLTSDYLDKATPATRNNRLESTFSSKAAIDSDKLSVDIKKNNSPFSSLSFSLGKTRYYGIMGPNGCGKSTLLKSLDGTFPQCGDKLADHASVISISQQEQLPNYVSEGNAICTFLHLWPRTLSIPKSNKNNPSSTYLKDLSEGTVFHNDQKQIIDKYSMITHMAKLLYTLDFSNLRTENPKTQEKEIVDYIINNFLLHRNNKFSGGQINLYLLAASLTVAKFSSSSTVFLLLDEIRAPLDQSKSSLTTNLIHSFICENSNITIFEVLHQPEHAKNLLEKNISISHNPSMCVRILAHDSTKENYSDYYDAEKFNESDNLRKLISDDYAIANP